jgi:hypothetical protein
MAFQEIQEQADVVAAGIVVAAVREQGLDQFFGSLLSVVAEGFVVGTRSGGETINQDIAPRSTPRREGDLISGLCWRAQGTGSKEGITPRR